MAGKQNNGSGSGAFVGAFAAASVVTAMGNRKRRRQEEEEQVALQYQADLEYAQQQQIEEERHQELLHVTRMGTDPEYREEYEDAVADEQRRLLDLQDAASARRAESLERVREDADYKRVNAWAYRSLRVSTGTLVVLALVFIMHALNSVKYIAEWFTFLPAAIRFGGYTAIAGVALAGVCLIFGVVGYFLSRSGKIETNSKYGFKPDVRSLVTSGLPMALNALLTYAIMTQVVASL